ncbi:MAG: hypothetical protein HC835_16335 [Oscillatoriales cyanobacterium RM2_1_1]|nr:hypothetical protein [Oscillatoriales cyanobacterium SM2_3_0]NJO47056.1 hypothetical protein [Oscillatoriales cyanobacterium RM2_1_1]
MDAIKTRRLVERLSQKIEEYQPYEKAGKLYFRRADIDQEILYFQATCDELRHGLTNYEKLLSKVKMSSVDQATKVALIYEIKYETTRRTYYTQRNKLNAYYKSLVERIDQRRKVDIQNLAIEQQAKLQTEIDRSEQLKASLYAQIQSKDEDVNLLKVQCDKYQIELEAERDRRRELARNNQSLGAYKSLYLREKQKTQKLKQDLQLLQNQHQEKLDQFIRLCRKYQQQLQQFKARCETLAKNNQSLGAYKVHYHKAKARVEKLKQEIQILQAPQVYSD